MTFETLLLRGLFIACLTVCGLILGAMVTRQVTPVKLAGDDASTPAVGMLLAPANRCALPPDGVVCPRPLG
jgi:hypothetical protein